MSLLGLFRDLPRSWLYLFRGELVLVSDSRSLPLQNRVQVSFSKTEISS